MADSNEPRNWKQYCAYRKTKQYSSWCERFKSTRRYLLNSESRIVEIEANFTLNQIILNPPERAEWRFDNIESKTVENSPARGFPIQVDVIGEPKRGTQIIAYYESLPYNSPPKDVRCDIFWISQRDFGEKSDHLIITNYYKSVIMNLSTSHIEEGHSFLSKNRGIARELREEAPEALKELGELVRKYGTARIETFGMESNDRDTSRRGR